MKILITYPPLESEKGIPLLSQNRQFQWFKAPTYIYPVIPASAATLLKAKGYDVYWKDGIASEITYKEWLEYVKSLNPDVIAMEAKTPIINQIYKIINELKSINDKVKIILMGDHPTACPEEAFKLSKTDYVITGGDYDFSLLSIVDYLSNKEKEIKEKGIYYRVNDSIANNGHFELKHNLDELPYIDRELTEWKLYAYKNGNYKKTPGTYIMSGRDCWYHRCRFCSWTTTYPTFRVRSVKNVLDEIGILIEKYKVKEIMDDTGTFPIGDWLREFCKGMIERGYNKKISIDCNMRLGNYLSFEDMKLMKKANFRLILVGIESANQETLDRIDKGTKIEEMINSVKLLRKAGLYPHITIMFGYPWETKELADNTLNLGKYLLVKNYAYTMQATVMIPYPGTPLYDECKKNNLLITEDYDRYDMREPVMKTPIAPEEIMKYPQKLYSVSFNPEFLLRKILSIRDLSDLLYFFKAGIKVLGHIFDFKNK